MRDDCGTSAGWMRDDAGRVRDDDKEHGTCAEQVWDGAGWVWDRRGMSAGRVRDALRFDVRDERKI
jgi:hypothetical protein